MAKANAVGLLLQLTLDELHKEKLYFNFFSASASKSITPTQRPETSADLSASVGVLVVLSSQAGFATCVGLLSCGMGVNWLNTSASSSALTSAKPGMRFFELTHGINLQVFSFSSSVFS